MVIIILPFHPCSGLTLTISFTTFITCVDHHLLITPYPASHQPAARGRPPSGKARFSPRKGSGDSEDDVISSGSKKGRNNKSKQGFF